MSKSISNLVSTESNLGRFNLSNQNEIRKYWLERDPENRFLEDVLGDQALDWVKGQNKICVDSVGNPENSPYYNRILNILDSKDKIPYVSKINNYYYNFWQDSSHKKGLLRRTTLESYLSSETVWEPVLSIDDLCAKESENWVYKHYTLLPKSSENQTKAIVLLALSRGGADATVIREFDLNRKEFIVDNGFILPEAKSRVAWQSRDLLLVGTDLRDQQSLTDSGYPRVVREWSRGTRIEDSKIVFEGVKTDVAVTGYIVSIIVKPSHILFPVFVSLVR